VDDLPSFCSMLCIFTRHGRREKEEADDEGRHAEERSGIADVSDSRIRADDAAEQGADVLTQRLKGHVEGQNGNAPGDADAGHGRCTGSRDPEHQKSRRNQREGRAEKGMAVEIIETVEEHAAYKTRSTEQHQDDGDRPVRKVRNPAQERLDVAVTGVVGSCPQRTDDVNQHQAPVSQKLRHVFD